MLMDKLQLTGRNLGRVFNSRSGCINAMHLCCYEAKQPKVKLKTRPKQLLGSLPIAFVLPALMNPLAYHKYCPTYKFYRIGP